MKNRLESVEKNQENILKELSGDMNANFKEW